MLRHHGADMGVMMLDADQLDRGLITSPLRGQISRMQVVDNNDGIDSIHLFQVLETFFIELECLVILHVADMLAGNGKCTFGQRERVLEVSTAAKHGWSAVTERDRLGCISSRAADKRKR